MHPIWRRDSRKTNSNEEHPIWRRDSRKTNYNEVHPIWRRDSRKTNYNEEHPILSHILISHSKSVKNRESYPKN